MEHTRERVPQFCSNCRKTAARSDVSGVCAHCGDRLIDKGYCPVCEDFLALPVGERCPKHLLPLEEEAPPRLGGRLAGTASSWVEVGRFADTLACQPARIRLENEGIPTMIDGERMGDRSMYPVATGGVRLRVPENLVADARIILSQTWSATTAALDIEEDWPDFDEDEPAPSELAQHHHRTVGPSTLVGYLEILAVGLALLLAALLFLS